MAITIGPNGELIKTVNSNSSRFSMPVPTEEQIGALSFINKINPRFEGVEEYKKNVLDSDGNFVPQLDDDGNALLDADGNALFETTDESRRYVSVPKIGYDSNLPDQTMAQNLYGTKYMPSFQFSTPKEIGRNVYYPDEENLMSEENVQPLIGGDSTNVPLQDKENIDRIGQISIGQAGAGIGAAIGNAYMQGDNTVDIIKTGISAINPIDGIGLKEGELTRSAAAKENVKGMISGQNQTASFKDRLNPFNPAGKANLTQTGFSAAGDALFQIAAGRKPVEAVKSAGKTAVLATFANAIIPGSGPLVSVLQRLGEAADIDINMALFGWDGKF